MVGLAVSAAALKEDSRPKPILRRMPGSAPGLDQSFGSPQVEGLNLLHPLSGSPRDYGANATNR